MWYFETDASQMPTRRWLDGGPVLASRGHGGILHSVLSSIARRVARTAACLVLGRPFPA
jgi:hypothetical protein